MLYDAHLEFTCILSKCCEWCEQRYCKMLQGWGKYLALNIRCCVVNLFYVAILHILW